MLGAVFARHREEVLEIAHRTAVVDDVVGVTIQQLGVEVGGLLIICGGRGAELLVHLVGRSTSIFTKLCNARLIVTPQVILALTEEVEAVELARIDKHGTGILGVLVQTRTVGQQLHLINIGVEEIVKTSLVAIPRESRLWRCAC